MHFDAWRAASASTPISRRGETCITPHGLMSCIFRQKARTTILLPAPFRGLKRSAGPHPRGDQHQQCRPKRPEPRAMRADKSGSQPVRELRQQPGTTTEGKHGVLWGQKRQRCAVDGIAVSGFDCWWAKRSSRIEVFGRRCDVQAQAQGQHSALAGFRIQPRCLGRASRPSHAPGGGPSAGHRRPKLGWIPSGAVFPRTLWTGGQETLFNAEARERVVLSRAWGVGAGSEASRGLGACLPLSCACICVCVCVCADACCPSNLAGACVADAH